jgi:uncharacterized protein
MKSEFDAARLDLKKLAQSGAQLHSDDTLADYPRLMAEVSDDAKDGALRWSARGELRQAHGASPEVWLHLQVQTCMPLVCQRCMGKVQQEVSLTLPFRFVKDEETAQMLDEEAEEDVLALTPSFDLRALIEDEVLMALPLVPRHEVCPTEVRLAVADPDFDNPEVVKPNPFAVLAHLADKKPG